MTARPKWAPVIGPQYHQSHPIIAAIGLPANGPTNRLAFLCPACGQPHTHSLSASPGYRAGDYVPVTLPCRLWAIPYLKIGRNVRYRLQDVTAFLKNAQVTLYKDQGTTSGGRHA